MVSAVLNFDFNVYLYKFIVVEKLGFVGEDSWLRCFFNNRLLHFYPVRIFFKHSEVLSSKFDVSFYLEFRFFGRHGFFGVHDSLEYNGSNKV